MRAKGLFALERLGYEGKGAAAAKTAMASSSAVIMNFFHALPSAPNILQQIKPLSATSLPLAEDAIRLMEQNNRNGGFR